MIRLWRAVALVGMVSLVAAACAPSATPGGTASPAGSAAPTAAQPVPGGRVVIGTFVDIQRLNPSTSNDTGSSDVSGKIYDSLVTIDPKTAEVKPWLGSWKVSADGLTFDWTIDPKANWSDGKPIIAKDFLARVKMQARSKVTPNKSTFNDIEGYQDYSTGKATDISGIKIDSADPKKFTVKFTRVFCPAMVSVFGSAPMPDHIFGKYTVDNDPTKVVDDAAENNNPPVASGPFKFKEWRKGDQTILTRNDAYFKGAPLVDELVFKVVADTNVLAAQLKTGELSIGKITATDVAGFQGEDRLKLYKWQANSYTYIGWRGNNPNVGFLADKRVRQALAYGIDTAAVVQSVLLGEGAKMIQHHPNVSWAAAPEKDLNPYNYDKAKAEDLLKAAGFAKGGDGFYAKEGKPLAITIVTNQGNKLRETFLQVATEQYKQIGVKINPKVEAFESLVPKLTGGSPEVEAVIIGWSLSADPDPFTIWHSSNVASPTKAGNNFVGYSNPEVDKLIEAGRNGPDCSQAARQKNYQALNKILNEDQPYMFGYTPKEILVADAKIQGIDPGTFNLNGQWNIEKWWFKK
ncbi:MAG TPA: ABC transporter substrate-binding protein [Candidatus Limnocylindria bacterium]